MVNQAVDAAGQELGEATGGVADSPLVRAQLESYVLSQLLLAVPHEHVESLFEAERMVSRRYVQVALDYIDEHLAEAGIEVGYTNVFWGGRSEIKPSEISPQAYLAWCRAPGDEPDEIMPVTVGCPSGAGAANYSTDPNNIAYRVAVEAMARRLAA